MATMTKNPSPINWWLWGGVAAAVVTVAAIIYTFGLFGFGAPASDPASGAPVVEQPIPAPTN
jgi:hypothetical protein